MNELKKETLSITVTYDPAQHEAPRNWNWAELIDALPDRVQVAHNGRLTEVMQRTNELDYNEIMQMVLVTILDRGEEDVIDVNRIVAYLNAHGTDDLYMNFIAPAIDKCEQAIREGTP